MWCTLAWVMCFVVGLFGCYCLRLLIAFDVYGCGYLVVRYWCLIIAGGFIWFILGV